MWKLNFDLEKMLNKMEKELCTDCINLNSCKDEYGCYEYWSEVKSVMQEWRKKNNK